MGIVMSAFTAAILSVNYGSAYTAEIIRAGIEGGKAVWEGLCCRPDLSAVTSLW